MNAPFHYDLEAITNMCRKTSADAIAAARIAVGEEGKLGIDAQERLIPAIEFLLVGQADLANRGVPQGFIVQAMGSIMGSAAVSAAKSSGNQLVALDQLMQAFTEAVVGLMSGKAPPNSTQRSARVTATRGGNT